MQGSRANGALRARVRFWGAPGELHMPDGAPVTRADRAIVNSDGPSGLRAHEQFRQGSAFRTPAATTALNAGFVRSWVVLRGMSPHGG
jgi:hypothetical protein